MNDLSLLLYFAGLSESLSGFFIGMSFLSVLLGGIAFILGAYQRDFSPVGSDENKKGRVLQLRALLFSVPALCIFSLVSVLLPSKETVYAIAASEVGEEVLDSETGGKAVEALNAWLDSQISGEKEQQ